MRILFLSNFYPPFEIGGYEQWCHEVALGLIERGHEVTVLTSRHGGRAALASREPGVRRELHLQCDLNYYRPADFFFKRRRRERQNLAALERAIRETEPDIVMGWGMWNLSHALPHACEQRMPGKVAYFVSNYWPSDTDPHAIYWKEPARRALTELLKKGLRWYALRRLGQEAYPPSLRLDNAVCCSEYVRSRLIREGTLPESAGVLLGGTEPKPFLEHSALEREPGGPLRLLYCGRLIHDKGPHTAVEALGLLRKGGWAGNVRLTILGSGHPDYEARLREMVRKLDIQDQVAFVRQTPREEIPSRLGQADVFLFTSIWPEPMARSVMEAMAAGLLVIGSEVGGQTEMLHDGENALTFQAEDAKTLARLIRTAAEDPERRRALALAGQRMVLEKFTLERMVGEIERLLEAVATGSSQETAAGRSNRAARARRL